MKILSFLRSWYVVGILGFAIPFTHDFFRHLIPVNIFLTTLLILVYHRPVTLRFILLTLLVALLGFGSEVAGVKTGLLFGDYAYGSILGPKVAAVPLIMGLNWVLMIYGGLAIASRTAPGIIPICLLSAVLVTASDIIIEQFAIMTGMWTWSAGDPPIRNYVGWFFVSFILSLIYYRKVKSGKGKVAIHIFVYQMILFILTLIIVKLLWP
jgi:putative membrane protein